jgi:hypothetical protein
MTGRPHDTSEHAWRYRRSIIAGLSPEDRLRTAFDLSESVREIRIAGLLSRNPGWTRRQAVHELVLRDTGIDLPSVS